MISTRRVLLLFYGVVFGVSWPLGWWLAIHGPYQESPLAGVFAFIPGIVGVTLSLLSGRGFGELGFRKPSSAAILVAVLAPTLAAAMSFGALAFAGIDAWLGLGAVTSGAIATAFAKFLIGALAEEPGWRGFLLARFRERGLAHRWELAGVTWSAWHYPLLFGAAVYSSSPRPWLSAAIYTVTLTAFGVLLGWLREWSNSLWPVIIAHAVHNVWIVGLMAVVFTPGPQHRYFAGESGVFLAAIYAGMAAPLVYARARERGQRG